MVRLCLRNFYDTTKLEQLLKEQLSELQDLVIDSNTDCIDNEHYDFVIYELNPTNTDIVVLTDLLTNTRKQIVIFSVVFIYDEKRFDESFRTPLQTILNAAQKNGAKFFVLLNEMIEHLKEYASTRKV